MREMRRKDRAMDKKFALSIIDKAQFATLATINEDSNPYCIPISFARDGDSIYLHSALQGTKIDNIRSKPKVSISFVGDVQVPPPAPKEEVVKAMDDASTFGRYMSNKFTTEFESTVVFGTAHIIDDIEEKTLALKLIGEKYTPFYMPYFKYAIEASLQVTCVIRIDIEHITGKRKKYDKDGIEMKWGRME